MTNSRSGLAKRLAHAMEVRSMTQSRLAKRLKVSQPAVSGWLKAKKAPTADNIAAIAKVLKITPRWLQYGEDEGPKPDPREQRREYSRNCEWLCRQAPPDGGRDYGNANVWSFKPGIGTLVREAGQNVLDAAIGAARMTFRIVLLKDDALARFVKAMKWDQLHRHLAATAEQEQKLGKLIEFGLQTLDEQKEMLLLVVEDEGTTGLIGPEDGTGRFAALCRNNLDSTKASDTAGGAFGLGKAAFWRTSLFSTVLFSSQLSEPDAEKRSDCRVIGRTELGWHELPGGEEDQAGQYAGPGWFGFRDEADRGSARAVSYWGNETLAADLYIPRQPGKPGTSIAVVGFYDPSADSQRQPRELADEIEAAIIDEFWPALASGKLKATVEIMEGADLVFQTKVDAQERVPELVSAVTMHCDDDVVDQLTEPGRVVRRMVDLRIPKRRDGEHGELVHKAILLVQRADDEALETGHVNTLAVYRGREMIIRYIDLSNIAASAFPFHAALLCGEASDGGAVALAAERFLRKAEPPSHNNWELTPEVKADYAYGAGSRILEFIEQARKEVRDLVKPPRGELSDGPECLKALFRIGTQTEDKPAVTVPNPSGKVDDQGRWVVRGRIRVAPAEGSAWLVTPEVRFCAETGGGQAVVWEQLEALKDCEVVGGSKLRIAAGVREAHFRGMTDPASHPIPANLSRITVEAIGAPETSDEGGED